MDFFLIKMNFLSAGKIKSFNFIFILISQDSVVPHPIHIYEVCFIVSVPSLADFFWSILFRPIFLGDLCKRNGQRFLYCPLAILHLSRNTNKAPQR